MQRMRPRLMRLQRPVLLPDRRLSFPFCESCLPHRCVSRLQDEESDTLMGHHFLLLPAAKHLGLDHASLAFNHLDLMSIIFAAQV